MSSGMASWPHKGTSMGDMRDDRRYEILHVGKGRREQHVLDKCEGSHPDPRKDRRACFYIQVKRQNLGKRRLVKRMAVVDPSTMFRSPVRM